MKHQANAFSQGQTFFKQNPTQFQRENTYFGLDDCKDAWDFIMHGSMDPSAL